MSKETTYEVVGGSLKEDLLEIITNLSVTETQLVSGLGTSAASSIRHEWLLDTLTAAKANAQIEGENITYHTLTNPSRLYNYTQIFKQGFKVSDTQRAVDEAGFDDRYSYEQVKALKMLKHDMEYALMRGSLASGTSAAARYLRGLKASLSLISNSSGTSLSETAFNDYLQLVWDNASTEVNAVYCPMYMKRKISGFTGGSTKNVEAADKRLINAIDVYEADAAHLVKIFPHRYATVSGTDTNYDILGIDEDLFKVAYLRKPFVKEEPTGGDYTGGNFITELTFENRHYNAGFWGSKYL